MPSRLFVVGDLHGCYDLLMAGLKTLNFDFEGDLLVCVGDLVDRGRQCLECVSLLDEPWFKAVRGNHEQMCIDGFKDIHYAEIHFKQNGGRWFYQLERQQRAQIVEKFAALPIVLEISFKHKKYGFVHAHIENNDWEIFKQEILLNTRKAGRWPVDLAIWGRERARAALDEARFQQVAHVDEVYLGHTVLPQATQKHNCFFIDTGAFMTGKLTVVELG